MVEFTRAMDGCRLAWRRDGDSGLPTLLFCNSIGTDHRLWEPQVAALRSRFDLIRYDMRGHGASDAPAGAYTLATLATDAVAVLDAAGVAQAHVCGLSLGGAVAQRLTLDQPARVGRLVLANTAARIGSAETWQARIDTVLSQGLAAIADAAIARFFDARFRDAAPATVATFRAMLLANPAHGYAGCCAALRDADLRAEIGAIRKPTLTIAGSLDVSTPPNDLRAIADAIPGTTYVELETAHLSNVEAADRFTQALSDFLGA